MTIPAITRVALWSRAETGVGPSIASGSHMNEITEIDFTATAMRKRSSQSGSCCQWTGSAVETLAKIIARITSAIRFVPVAM